MKSRLKITLSVIFMFGLAACNGAGNGNLSDDGGYSSSGGQGTNDYFPDDDANPSMSDDSGGEGSSTTVSNPTLIIDTKNASILFTRDNDHDNFKKIANNEERSIIRVVGGTTNEDGTTTESPRVNQFIQGPNGEISMALSGSIDLDNMDCSVLYNDGSSETPECLVDNSQYSISGTPKFDNAGNVYYYAYDQTNKYQTIVKRSPLTGQSTNILNENINIYQWNVHPNGTVFMTGSANGKSFFRKLTPNGSLENIVSAGTSVGGFIFVDRNHLIYSSSYTMLLTIDGEDEGKTEAIVPSISVDLGTAQRDSDGRIYGMQSHQKIYSAYPGVPYEVRLGMDYITSYKIIDQTLFAVGEIGTSPVFMKTYLNTHEDSVNLIEGIEIEIYKYTVADEFIYFDGLRFSDNKVIFGKINLNNGAITEVDALESEFLQMESRSSPYDATYSDVDDLRLELDNEFTMESVSYDAFNLITDAREILNLENIHPGHLAIGSETDLYFFDIQSDSPALVSRDSVDNSGTNPDEYQMVVSNNNLYYSADHCDLHVADISDINHISSSVYNSSACWSSFVGFAGFAVTQGILFSSISNNEMAMTDLSGVKDYSKAQYTDYHTGEKHNLEDVYSAYSHMRVEENNSSLLYSFDAFGQLHIFDVSRPDDITLLSAFEVCDYCPSIKQSEVYGNYIYAPDDGDMYIINTSDKTHVYTESEVNTFMYDIVSMKGIDDYLFVLTNSAMTVFDISNRTYPIPVQTRKLVATARTFTVVKEDFGYRVFVGGDDGIETLLLTKN
ncbi:MAG: hypothetical protein HQM16_08650 [Deltaproteobacteria bacterium]|nr:hypothetical protein [Deltaproteobacteria bacterium]